MWAISSFAQVDAVLRDRRFARCMPTDNNSTSDETPTTASRLKHFRQVEKYSLLNLEPPHHTRIRSLVNHAFIARQIKPMATQIESIALGLLQAIKSTGSADLLPTYATPLPAKIIAAMLGVPEQFIEQLLNWSHAMVKVYTLVQSPADELAADTAAKEFAALLYTLIEQRRLQPSDDLLSLLVHTTIDGDTLTTDEIISTAVLLLNAGHEATVHQTGNAIKTILESGLDPAALFASQKQTSATVQELMRFDAPLHLFTRFALQDVDLNGISLKKGEQVALLLGAANRDPDRFAHADRFDPYRSDGGHVTLGAGIHYCVGAQLARLELEISLRLVFSELPHLALARQPCYKDAFHFHGLDALHVTWQVS